MMALSLAAKMFHFEIRVEQTEVVNVLSNLLAVIGTVVAWYGRYRHGDITLAGQKNV